MELKQRLAAGLEDARRRTDELLGPLDDAQMLEQHDPLLSPPAWDLAHIGVYEELWLVQNLSGTAPLDAERMHVYDAFEQPRRVRGTLPLMTRAQATAYRDEVRRRALDLLEEARLDDSDELLRGGFVHRMVIEHEHQHDETILQTLQLLRGGYLPSLPPPRTAPAVERDLVEIPGGSYVVGAGEHAPWDNEHPQHQVDLAPFCIERFPVTSGDYLAFIEDGGYQRPELWDPAGRDWVRQSRVVAPKHWRRGPSGAWLTDRFGHLVPVDPLVPVMHVCWYEADAYARWRGGRLPTEFEWEVAATWNPAASRPHRYPWGDGEWTPERANLDQRMFGAAPVGSFPSGRSALGCEQMVGEVWEWTSSHFLPYPGFRAHPYPEYSEVFFGTDYRVLRGASWAARPSVARASFRNWDYPIRRQIFAGLRCAFDGDHR